jgi:hypothetical protein
MTDVPGEAGWSPARAQRVAVVAAFGAAWGAAEIFLGALLRAAYVPMHGTLMTGVGIIIMLVARRTLSVAGQGGRGVCLAVGVVAAAIVPLSVSPGMHWAMVGVLAEAACLEAVLWMGKPRRLRFGLAGFVVALVPLMQRLLVLVAWYGPAAMSTFRTQLLDRQGGAKLGLAGLTAGMLIVVVAALSAVYGLVCGSLAWSVAGQILRRLGRAAG